MPGADLLYPDGSILLCHRLVAPNSDLIAGARYIVQRCRRGKLELTVRELRRVDGQAWLWPCSTKPDHHEPLRLETVDAATCGTVAIIGIVVASWQPERTILID